MQLTTITTALLSLGMANAAALGKPSTWHVSGWEIRGSPGGSVYNFNITGAPSDNAPGFKTSCEGFPGNTTVCKDISVSTKVTEAKYPLWNVWVQHEWHKHPKNESEQTYWQYGSANASQSHKFTSFDIHPTGFFGVA